jgi:ABC-type branched-subunit amino acid transport system substrate-binding protein
MKRRALAATMRAAAPLALLLSTLLLLLLSACTGGGPQRRDDAGAEAQLIYDSFEQEYLLHRDQRALELGTQLLTTYPDHPLADAVHAKMITAAVRLPDLDRAEELALAFCDRYPHSVHRDTAMRTAARGLAHAGRQEDALRVLARLAEVQVEPALEATQELAATLAAELEPARVDSLAADPELLSLAPALQGLVAPPSAEPTTPVVPGRVGVLTPLTGRYARFGNAFQAGVQLARRHEDPAATGPWEIMLEDTQGDPVIAALAARSLCEEQGCQLLVGALLSATTATVAMVAQQHGIPLVSPTATNERLGELGDKVLQTNLFGQVEVKILARLATDILLKRRFAIIRPDTPEGEALARAFATQVTELGGEIVVEEVFDASATDFRSQVLDLRRRRPEVVFAPTTVDQMVLLGPQLDFYKVGALVLGPSEWNSARLMDRAGSVMERTVFPVSEVVYPAEWSAEFQATWPAAQYEEESTKLARSAYLATRLALRVMSELPGGTTQEIATSLQEHLSGRDVDVAGPEGYASVVRLVEEGEARRFPGHLYQEAWLRQLRADSLAAADSLALADSLGLSQGVGPGRPADLDAAPWGAPTPPDSLGGDPPARLPDRR